jgi:MoaA/NifB/PqqE/SkfB family radical SAM enzyme
MTTQAKSGFKPKFYSGWRRELTRLGLLLSFGKYMLQRKKYPLFYLRASKKGAMDMVRLGDELQLTKSVRFGDRIYSSLVVPGYPSKAFDQMAAGGGLNFGAAGTPLKPHGDNVILAITNKCNYQCLHCYEKHNINVGEAIPVERWKDVIRDIQEIGIGIVILSGGEPMLRFQDVLELLRRGDKNRSDFHLHTSGNGVTPERAKTLKEAGLTAAAVGLDDVDPARYDRLRGFEGAFEQAVNSLRWFNDAGIMTYLNVCVTKELLYSGDIWRLYDLAKELNVSFIQLLEPRPQGGYAAKSIEELFSRKERQMLTDFYLTGQHDRKYRNHPILYYVAYIEHARRMGCTMGGVSHFTIDSAGNVNPCVFVPISFGNILNDDFNSIYRKMRSEVRGPIHKECPSICLADVIHSARTQSGQTPVHFDSIKKQWEEVLK